MMCQLHKPEAPATKTPGCRSTLISCWCFGLMSAAVALFFGGAAWGQDSPLADAAERQECAALVRLLEAKADVNQAQVDGTTALHWAAYHDDHEAARLLVRAGADVSAANRYGVTPLVLACESGSATIVELLLESGADPNAKLPGGQTALMTAARTGRLDAVKALLACGADVNAKERRQQTALMWAAAEGHADVVQALLDAGADFRTPLDSGFTPLLFAVREGRRDVVAVLLKAGADVNAAMYPKTRFARVARQGTSALLLAVENGHFELALDLVRAGADPNDQRSGFAPLHAISWVRKPNRGDGEDGDPAPRGSGNLTSLQFVRELVAAGANVNLRLKKGESGRGILTRRGATPFFMACVTADVPLMKLLVELGADPRIPNAENATPLMAAAGLGCRAPGEEAGTEEEVLEAVKLAIELGGDVNAVDDNGETAMHGAAYKNLPKVVALLAERGAKIDVWQRKNKYGWTPITIAEGFRVGNFKPSPDTVAALHRVLLAAGVTPPPPTKRGQEGKDY
jgi:ankyrin repeat protein